MRRSRSRRTWTAPPTWDRCAADVPLVVRLLFVSDNRAACFGLATAVNVPEGVRVTLLPTIWLPAPRAYKPWLPTMEFCRQQALPAAVASPGRWLNNDASSLGARPVGDLTRCAGVMLVPLMTLLPPARRAHGYRSNVATIGAPSTS